MQELAHEIAVFRRHNLAFKEGEAQATLLLVAEAAVTFLAFERFLRIILGENAKDSDTLYNLLEKATSTGRNLIRLPWDDQGEGIKKVVAVRNALLHGNYEQASRDAGCHDVAYYFKTVFAAETDTTFKILEHVMNQIDPETGKPVREIGTDAMSC